MSTERQTAPSTKPGFHEASGGDRGDAGSANIEQSRAIGQDDPTEGSRLGREADKSSGFPGSETQPEPSSAREQAIRQAAYEAYLRRGAASGSDVDDWLEAERTLDQQNTTGQGGGQP